MAEEEHFLVGFGHKDSVQAVIKKYIMENKILSMTKQFFCKAKLEALVKKSTKANECRKYQYTISLHEGKIEMVHCTPSPSYDSAFNEVA